MKSETEASMKTDQTHLASHFGPMLEERERELRAILQRDLEDKSAAADSAGEVTDFKDRAAELSQDAVDEAQGDQAAIELEQVRAALQRMADGTYGLCLDCGAAIDARRLEALPASAHCVACQELREQGRTPSAIRPA
jgi:DnaK suppressor protein